MLDCFAICAPGLVRSENQDNLYLNGFYRENLNDNSVFKRGNVSIDRGLYAVADGMGGESHGEFASFVTVQGMINENISFDGCLGLTQYILERNAVICDLMKENIGVRMGSTFASLYIDNESAVITNIGDSRVYRLHDGMLEQLSRDHTLARQLVDFGIITEEASFTHPERHKLTQHLGVFPSEMIIEPYNVFVEVQSGDVFLLCSDGLTDMIRNEDIKKILETYSSTEEKSEALFAEALKNGGKDNITVMVVKYNAVPI